MDSWIDELSRSLGEAPLTSAETAKLLKAAADVARRYVTPAQASVVVVGNAAQFLDDLRKIRPDLVVIPAAELDLSSADLGG